MKLSILASVILLLNAAPLAAQTLTLVAEEDGAS